MRRTRSAGSGESDEPGGKKTAVPKSSRKPEPVELTYPQRTAARLTGLSPELLRAWEARYGVVRPQRTPGGTRRYSAAEVYRLRLVKAAVDAGRRIGRVARLETAELEQLAAERQPKASPDSIEAILAALERLDALEAQRLLALQLSAWGPLRFAREVALPLVREIGERWSSRQLAIASEHLASGLLRAMLGSALQPTALSPAGPRIVFATPTGERHELGLQMAALTALGAGANPIYLGAELPVDELLAAVASTRAEVLALGLAAAPRAEAESTIAALRSGLPDDVCLWVGGAGARGLTLPTGVERLETLEALEGRVALLSAVPHRRT